MRLHEIDGSAEGIGLVAEGFNPVDIGLAAKPGELTLGVVTMALLSFGYGDLLTDPFEENRLRLPVAERVEGFDWAVAGKKRASFCDETGGEHFRATLIEAGIEFGARWIEADAKNTKAGERVPIATIGRRQFMREGSSRGETYFNGANQPGRVVCVNASGRCWIETSQHPV